MATAREDICMRRALDASQLTTQKAVVLRVSLEICFSWGDAVFGVVVVAIPTKA